MRKCHHHYQWYDGKLKCARCGHQKWLTHGAKRKIGKACVLTVLVVIGFFGYQHYGSTITNYVQTVKPQDIIINSVTKALEVKQDNLTLTAYKIHDLINKQRKSNGLTLLSWNPQLAQAGLNHSNDMAKRNYFDHDSPYGQTFTMRYSEVGFTCQISLGSFISGGGENIMFMQGYSEGTIAGETVSGWMNSAGHRANILTAYFQSEGIGVAESDDGRVYVTEDFC